MLKRLFSRSAPAANLVAVDTIPTGMLLRTDAMIAAHTAARLKVR